MARASGTKVYNTFVGGLVTEANPLTFPENATYDENNYELSDNGEREVRLGIDLEAGGSLSSYTKSFSTQSNGAFKCFEWLNVANTGTINFLVVQIEDTLHFYNLASDPVSSGVKSFTVDLNVFKLNATTGNNVVQMDSGNGWLFVVSSDLKPFYVKYNVDTDDVTATEIGIKVRDTEGLDDGLDPDEEPTTLSDTHNYNLKNQGWVSPGNGIANPITAYQAATGEYPPNSKQWWASKDASDNFDPAGLAKLFLGTGRSPRGHFILDPFNKDRATASGIGGLTTETSTTRPTAVAFFAGRAWFFHESTLYFSQIVEGEQNIGRCYQEADPTAEEINEIIDTDGGTIPLPEAAICRNLFVTGDSLLVFCSNGVWEISGSVGQGFRPTDYSVNKVGSVGCLSSEAVVDVDGIPIWWSDRGIYTIQRSQSTDRIVPQSLSEPTIQTYYENEIPDLAKEYAVGKYDKIQKKVRWLWRDSNLSSNRFNFNRQLNLDISLGAFYPWSFGELASDTAYPCGIFVSESIDNPEQDVNVVTSANVNIVTSTGVQIVSTQSVETASKATIKYFCVVPQSLNNKYAFAEIANTGWTDWEGVDGTGIPVDAYMETGFLLEGDAANWKQAPYVYVFFRQGVDQSCLMQYKWDWATDESTGKWSTKRQVYKDRSGFIVAVSRQKVRGKGKAVQVRFENENGKGHTLLGWSTVYGTTTNP